MTPWTQQAEQLVAWFKKHPHDKSGLRDRIAHALQLVAQQAAQAQMEADCRVLAVMPSGRDGWLYMPDAVAAIQAAPLVGGRESNGSELE